MVGKIYEMHIFMNQGDEQIILQQGGHGLVSTWMISVQLAMLMACPYFEETSTRTGFTRLALCSFATLVVMVAENKYVVRSLGMTLRI